MDFINNNISFEEFVFLCLLETYGGAVMIGEEERFVRTVFTSLSDEDIPMVIAELKESNRRMYEEAFELLYDVDIDKVLRGESEYIWQKKNSFSMNWMKH